MLAAGKQEIPVADRTISRDRLHADYGELEGSELFALWNLISTSLKTDADNEPFLVRSRQWLVGTGLLLSIVCRNPMSEASA